MQSVGAPEKKWMDFFDNPNAYWDNRHNKRNPRAPDFKHKDDKDAVLWLDSRDTPSCEPSTQTTSAVQDVCGMYRMLGCMEYHDSGCKALGMAGASCILASARAQCCMLM